MNCPSCGAPLRLEEDKDYLMCDYCKRMCFPQANDEGVRLLGEPTDLLCPVCSIPLMHAALDGSRIQGCEQCRGILIAMEAFLGVLSRLHSGHDWAARHPPNPRDLERRTCCPKCHERMNTHFYAGPGNIVIDTCSYCQLNWLDHGELTRVIRAPDRNYISCDPLSE